MEKIYKAYRIVDGKPRWVIVNENGNVINKESNKEELIGLDKEPRKPYDTRKRKKYTDEELLNYLRQFYEENERSPVRKDFSYNPEYPSFVVYQKPFGGFEKAKKLVEIDLDTRVKQGIFNTKIEKGRFVEIALREMFNDKGIDLSGNNCSSYCDGICPTGQIYEVKSSRLSEDEGRFHWGFGTQNKDKDDDIEAIQWYYFVAFNSDYTKILYIWRVPGEIVEGVKFNVWIHASKSKFNIETMREYDVTDKFEKIIMNGNNEILKKLCRGNGNDKTIISSK